MKINAFERVLRQENYAQNTITAYTYAVRDYYARYPRIDKLSLLEYRELLIETKSPKTVNLRLQGLNKYLSTIGKKELQLKFVKVQDETFLENVIGYEGYQFFKNHLCQEQDMKCYFAVRYLAATGARISELIRLKVEHVQAGYFDICSKGGKIRRLYIPDQLREETLRWLRDRQTGYLFLNRYGKRITSRGIADRLKFYAN